MTMTVAHAPAASPLSPTFRAFADSLADHIALQSFLLATDSIGVLPTRGFLVAGPPGSAKSTVLNHVSQKLAESHNALSVPLSAVAGVRFYAKDDNQSKSYVRKVTAALMQEHSNTRPMLLVLDDLLDVTAYESLETSRTLFLADLAKFFATLEPCHPAAIVASFADGSSNPKPSLFTSPHALPEISEPIRCEITHTILATLKASLSVNATGLPLQSPEGPLASFAAHIAALTPGYTPRDLTLVIRQLVFLATQPPAARDSLADHFAATLHVSPPLPTLHASHVPQALARVRPSLAVSQHLTRAVPRVAWTDVAGYAQVCDQLRAAVVQPLRCPDAYERVGARAPRGVLLYGPPGCGKTLLVHALASEPGVNVVSVKGPEILSKYFGESEARLRALFTQARKSPPCILFFDEMDVLGVKRAWSGSDGSSSIDERVLSTLLNEMDGVATQAGVVVVGCTNRPWAMDDALLRPGRLDQLVYVPLPSEADRLAVLKACKTQFAPDVDLGKVARAAVGCTGGHLKVLVREAGIKALVQCGPQVDQVAWEHVVEAAQDMGIPLGVEDAVEVEGLVGDDDAAQWDDVDTLDVKQRLASLQRRANEVEAPYVEFLNKRSASR